jgi:hypothetical protein
MNKDYHHLSPCDACAMFRQRLDRAEAALAAAREEIAALRASGSASLNTVTACDNCTTFRERMVEHKARAERLREAIETAPHDSGCWNPVSKVYECYFPCWKAAALKEEGKR